MLIHRDVAALTDVQLGAVVRQVYAVVQRYDDLAKVLSVRHLPWAYFFADLLDGDGQVGIAREPNYVFALLRRLEDYVLDLNPARHRAVLVGHRVRDREGGQVGAPHAGPRW